MRNTVLLFFILSFGCCGSGPREIQQVDAGATTPALHLIPFECSYLGFPIGELSDCYIACPSEVFQSYDLESFTSSLQCTHPNYEFLQCRTNF